MRSPGAPASRIVVVAVLSGLVAVQAARAATITKYVAGSFTCFSGCTPASTATVYLEGVAFTGSYSYDDAATCSSGDPSTFCTYNNANGTVSLNIGNGLYTVSVAGAGIEVEKAHSQPNFALQDEVYFLISSPVFGGTGTFTALNPNIPESLIHYVDRTATVILPDTSLTGWPQTVAAWSTGFAGVDFVIQDSSFNPVEFRGAFTTISDAPLLASPTISTSASLAGGALVDSATVNGRVNPLASTVDFRLYGPDDGTCANPPAFQSLGVSYPAAGGAVSSAPFAPTLPGTYRWIASYSGDMNNNPAAGACNDPGESAVVGAALVPTLSPLAVWLLTLTLLVAGGIALRRRR